MNEAVIQERLFGYFDHLYKLTNCYIFGWESDYFGITKSTGYCYEVEIKISKADFMADFRNKEEKHSIFNDKNLCFENPEIDIINIPKQVVKKDWRSDKPQWGDYCNLQYRKNIIPNRFYYCVPDELVEKIEPLLPKYAGLLSFKDGMIRQIKNAPILHKRELMKDIALILLSKFYYKYNNERFKVYELKSELNRKNQYYTDPVNFNDNIEQLTLEME